MLENETARTARKYQKLINNKICLRTNEKDIKMEFSYEFKRKCKKLLETTTKCCNR